MFKRTASTKLQLNKQTVRVVAADHLLERVAGGSNACASLIRKPGVPSRTHTWSEVTGDYGDYGG